MAIADSEPVQKVRKALKDAGLDDGVIELDAPLESAAEAAKTLKTEPGAIVQTLVYAIGKRLVMALIAGDRATIEENLPAVFFLEGEVSKPSDAEIRGITGFTADCVPPVGPKHQLPTVMDRSLKRFENVYALAGDPQCVFKISVTDLKRLTGAIVSWNVAQPPEGEAEAEMPPLARNKTFSGERDAPEAPDAPGGDGAD